MFNPSSPDALVSQVAKVSRSDRWFVYRRLQELTIPCWCPEDGSLWVEIHHGIQAILLRSTVQQLVSSRPELVDWLERCWETPMLRRSSGVQEFRSSESFHSSNLGS